MSKPNLSAKVFTASQADTSFFSSLGVTGYVAASGRGLVSGTASGIGGSFQKVIHWHNTNNQYWTYADSSGKFTSPAMRPGTYTMTLYQTELKVAETSVTVTAGSTASKNIANGVAARKTIWTIGNWDGQPTGFRNADKQLRMHPSDKRMSSWGPLTYTVGTSKLTDVPMALWKGVNDPFTIKFTLSAAQAGAATLRIGTTLSFAGARPQAKVNNYNAAAPASPAKIDSRGVTRGAYRGNGEVYDVKIPAGTLVAGANTIIITVASGSSGATYLAPNIVSQYAISYLLGLLTGTDFGRYRAFPVNIPKYDRLYSSVLVITHTHQITSTRSAILYIIIVCETINGYELCSMYVRNLEVLLCPRKQSVYRYHISRLLDYNLQSSVLKKHSRNLASGQDCIQIHDIYQNMITPTERGDSMASLIFNKT
jgi:hypothetical protein